MSTFIESHLMFLTKHFRDSADGADSQADVLSKVGKRLMAGPLTAEEAQQLGAQVELHASILRLLATALRRVADEAA